MFVFSHILRNIWKTIDQRYLVQQNKISRRRHQAARVRQGHAQQGRQVRRRFLHQEQGKGDHHDGRRRPGSAIDWAASKKPNAHEYATKIICVGQ
jgi:hypothetical protein